MSVFVFAFLLRRLNVHQSVLLWKLKDKQEDAEKKE